MHNLVYATNNAGKTAEANHFLKPLHISVLTLKQVHPKPLPQVEENGISFAENALIKARAYYNLISQPLISDDSGLVVPALDGAPGIYSARYAGANATDAENNQRLIHELKKRGIEQTEAWFEIALVFKSQKEERLFSARCKGIIKTVAQGEKGFGYDPLFWVLELKKSFAELSIKEKNHLSHRGQALEKLALWLREKNINFIV